VLLEELVKLGAPVSKAHAPNPPLPLPGGLLRPLDHQAWYEIFDPQVPRFVRVKNQFTSENKGAIWAIGNARYLVVPAFKDFLGPLDLEQHWKCYEGIGIVDAFNPQVIVNLEDQFHLEPNVVVGPARYLCNPVQKTVPPNPPEPPPSFPNQHFACYDIIDAPLGSFHSLHDQFGTHGNIVEEPELLCLPSIKYLPEPGVLASFGSGLMLLGWLDRRRRRRALGR